MLIFGKTRKPQRITSNAYPDTSKNMIVSVPVVEGKGSNRRFLFNKAAQDTLDLNKQINPTTILNDRVIFAYNEEVNKLYIGLYNKEAFAEIEKVAGEIPTLQIGKTTMGFSSKDLYEGLERQFGDNWKSSEEQYFRLVDANLENTPVTMYELMPTSEELELNQAAIENTDEEDDNETTQTANGAEPVTIVAAVPTLEPVGQNVHVTVDTPTV